MARDMTFLGTTSGGGACPGVFETDTGSFVVQGSKVTDPKLIAKARAREGGLPEHETLVEIPEELVAYFPKEVLAKYAIEARV